jgi:hypothetical protein
MAAERLAARVSGKAEVYQVDLYASMRAAILKGMNCKRTSWTFRYTVDTQEAEVEIGYTLDWSKGWKLLESKVFLERPAGISIASSTTTTISTCTSTGVYVAHLERGPDCELRSKAAIEEATGNSPSRPYCHVKVELLFRTSEKHRMNDELVKSLMDSRDDTGDMELWGQGFVIKAHSNVLALRSAPLKAKFDRWDEGRPFVFTLDESVTEEVARSMFHYLYTLEVPKFDCFADKRPLFTLADQLGLNKLIEDWAMEMKLDGEDFEEIMLWPEIELPQMSSLKARVEPKVLERCKAAIDEHGMELGREVLLAVRKRKESGESERVEKRAKESES